MDPAVVEQVRIAAARRGGKAALRSWVTQAFLRVLRMEADPRPQPKLILCAACVARNLERFKLHTPGPAGSGTMPRPRQNGEGGCPDPAAPSSSSLARLLQKIEPPGETVSRPDLVAPDAAIALPTGPAPPGDPGTLQQPSLAATEVARGLWVGNDGDYAAVSGRERWSWLQAAKEPWHRAMVGYQTRSAPEGPERLAARRGNRMALNLIDVRELGPGGESYTPEEVIRTGLQFLAERLYAGDQVLVHSGHPESGPAGLAFLYLQQSGTLPEGYEAGVEAFRCLYPGFAPHAGFEAYLRRRADVSGVDSMSGSDICECGDFRSHHLPASCMTCKECPGFRFAHAAGPEDLAIYEAYHDVAKVADVYKELGDLTRG
jgi:hypothetical protein